MESTKRKKILKIVLIVAAILIVIRLILPFIILHYANKALAGLHSYHGKIRDIDLALYRGAYKIKHIYLHKKDTISGEETEFFDCPLVDLSIHWGALMKGKLAGEFELSNPSLRFVKDKIEPKQVVSDSSDFRKLLDDFMPLDVNRFEIKNGVVKYKDQNTKPPVDIYMSKVDIRAENLSNIKSAAVLPATVIASADIYGGTLDFNMQLDPMAVKPTFDMNTELRNTHLPDLNNFFKAYANIDVSRGEFGLYAEAAAKEGKFAGYVKPIIKDLKVIGPEDKNDPLLTKFWEGFVGGLGLVFRNIRHDQVATKIPLEGTFENTRINIWMSLLEILKNAFIQALRPSIDEEINLKTVENKKGEEEKPLNKLFRKDREKEKENKKKKKDEKKD